MKRIKLDRQDDRIKEFFRALPLEPDGIELELNGKVICKVVGPHLLTTTERDALLQQRRELMRRARQRSMGIPAKVLEREINEAVDEVRRRQ